MADTTTGSTEPAALPAIPTASATIPQAQAVHDAPPKLQEVEFPSVASKPIDMAVAGGPLVRRGESLIEMRPDYQQSGRVTIAGDTITQQVGRGKTAEYSMAQLAAHAKDPAYFEATMKYAAERGDTVTIGFSKGVMSAHDLALERSLPKDIPLRDPILRASVEHDIDPVLLAAVGVQETKLGANYMGRSEPDYNMKTHRGDVEADSKGGHGYGPFQLDDRSHSQAELNRAARDPYYAAEKAAEMLSQNLKANHGNVKDALHVYNSGSLSVPTSPTDWGSLGNLSYPESTMRFYDQIKAVANQELHRTEPGMTR